MKNTEWVSVFTDSLVALGPAIGYGFQYHEMEVKNSSEGFAPQVSIIVLISMIARIFFWLVLRFPLPILVQAIVLCISQIFVLYQYQRLHKPKISLSSSENTFTRYSNIRDC